MWCKSPGKSYVVTCTSQNAEKYLSIMDSLQGQYVIYGPVRIILTEDEVWVQYNPNRSIYNILTE